MYVWDTIDRDELTLTMPKTGTSPAAFGIVDEYFDFLLGAINTRLADLKAQYAGLGSFRLVREESSSEADVAASKTKAYRYDFRVVADTVNGHFESRGMRFEAAIKGARAQKCLVGVRAVPASEKEAERYAWRGEVVEDQRSRGGSQLYAGYSAISSSTVTTQTSPKGGFVQGKATVGRSSISGRIYILLTGDNLFLFSAKDRAYPRCFLSFIMFRHVNEEHRYMYQLNGWRCDDTKITSKTKRDSFFDSRTTAQPNVDPDLWMRENWLITPDKKVHWFLPNVYMTNDHRMQHCTEVSVRHMNQSTGQLEETPAFQFLLDPYLGNNTRKTIMAVV
jgi:hypothetical protein